ncbi:hypothetical protein IQ255_20175 [Pleurocapsales cyanobacterium LEGE 10410]|nr:hypothetical protein [Pleurocapsales cyanobacterium LEGE 10410]
MKNTKDYPSKKQQQTTKDVRISVPKNTDRLPLFLASNPKEMRMQIPLEPITHPEGGILERLMTIDPWNDVNSKGEIVPKYLNTTTLEYWFWICRLWQEMPEPERSQGIVIWTRYELLKLMSKTTGGKALKVHDDHITRLAAVTFFLGDCFFNSVDNQHMKSLKLFSVFHELELTEMKNGEVVMLDKCRAKIHPLIVQNHFNDFTKPINLSVYSSIHPQATLARKLYTRLDTQFSHHNRFEISTEKFFRENGIFGKKYENPSARKQNLAQAIKQLTDKTFSSGKAIKGYKFEKTADGKDWKIIVWARRSEVISAPDVESAPKKQPTKPASKPQDSFTVELNPEKLAAKPQGLAPLKQIVSPSKVTKETTDKSSSISKELKTFLDRFGKLFKHADKDRMYRSRSVKAKAQEFINQYKVEKSLDFLSYCSELSSKNQFAALAKANTPAYLLGFKVGQELLINSWLHDRASESNRKRELKAQSSRRKEYERDIFSKEKNPEYQQYINSFISELSELQQLDFEEYFRQKEAQTLAEKGKSYQQMYSKSKLLQKQFSLDCLMKFSKEFLPKPVYTFEEWVKVNYPDEYKRFYR